MHSQRTGISVNTLYIGISRHHGRRVSGSVGEADDRHLHEGLRRFRREYVRQKDATTGVQKDHHLEDDFRLSLQPLSCSPYMRALASTFLATPISQPLLFQVFRFQPPCPSWYARYWL